MILDKYFLRQATHRSPRSVCSTTSGSLLLYAELTCNAQLVLRAELRQWFEKHSVGRMRKMKI